MVGRIPLELPDSAVESIRRLPGSCEAAQFWEAAQRVLSESGLSAAMPIIEPGYAYGRSKVTRIKTLRGGKIGWHAFRMLTIATSSFNVSRAEDYGLNILHCVAPGNEVIEIVPDKLPLRLFYRTLKCSECRSIDRASFSMPLYTDALAAEFSRGRTLVSTIGGTLTDERGRTVIDSLNLKGVPVPVRLRCRRLQRWQNEVTEKQEEILIRPVLKSIGTGSKCSSSSAKTRVVRYIGAPQKQKSRN